MVLDRHWNILMTNEAMNRVMGLFPDPAATAALGPPNAMRLSYHPAGAAALHRQLGGDGGRVHPVAPPRSAAHGRRRDPSACSTSSCPTPTSRATGKRSTSTRRRRRSWRSSCARATRASASSRSSRASARPTTSRCTSSDRVFLAADAATEQLRVCSGSRLCRPEHDGDQGRGRRCRYRCRRQTPPAARRRFVNKRGPNGAQGVTGVDGKARARRRCQK